MVDGLNAEDPGWRLLARRMATYAGRPVLWMHSGEPSTSQDSAVCRSILDVREQEGARARIVGPRLPGARDPLGAERFDAVAYWPRAHLGKDFSLACFGRAALHLSLGGSASGGSGLGGSASGGSGLGGSASDGSGLGGSIYVSGRKQKGIKSLAAALEELFGDVETVQRERGYHLLRAQLGPGVDLELARTWADQRYVIRDPALGELELATAPGVFSRRSLDEGTRALIEVVAAQVSEAPRRVLDLCAGVGPLGLWAATRWPEAWVRCVDSNLLAAHMCRLNAQGAGVASRVQVSAQAGLEPEAQPGDADDPAKHTRFGLALINPPTHAGPEALHALVAPLRAHMVQGAPAYFVVNRAGRLLGVLEALGASARTWPTPKHVVVEARWTSPSA